MKAFMIASVIVVGALAIIGAVVAQSSESEKQIQQTQTPFAELRLDTEGLAAIVAEQDPNTYLIDVRTPEEYGVGAIPGAINIPYDVIADRLPTEDKSARIVVYCRSGGRSRIAKAALEKLGFTSVNDFGGIGNWTEKLVVPE